MRINFNIDRLDKLLYDFYRLTGLTISVWDADFHQLSFQPKQMCGFCRLIKASPEGNHRCFLSDQAVCKECAATGKPVSHTCHAGLIDTAVPIQFKDTVLGYMMFGQVTDKKNPHTAQTLRLLSRELHVKEAALSSAYEELDVFDQEKIESAGSILKMATRYLWLSEYIEIGYHTQASQIDDYIRGNLRGDLSVETLCRRFGISKNRLYELSHEWFHMPIGNFITSVRIEEAKKLLSTTDLPVHQVSTAVGIGDYSYFTKIFKTNVGVQPLKYRKNFPFSLHREDEEPKATE